MRSNRFLLSASLAIGMFAAFVSTAMAQPEARMEPSFDVILQLVVGSSDGAKGELPANMAAVAKNLKKQYSFSGFRLANTLQTRVANSGAAECKTVANGLGAESDGSPSFLEFSIRDLKAGATAKGTSGFQAEAFRLTARVPIEVRNLGEGPAKQVRTYEQLAMSSQKLGLAENTPTVVGTLNLPGTSGTIFVVMTIKPVDE